MRKFLSFILAAVIVTATLVSCANNDIDVPTGLQIVKISEASGYQFFGPEGWIIANDGEIAASYVSTINNTSITFVEADMPEGDIKDYFEDERVKFPYEITVVEEKETKFGNAESAYSYVYTFEYEERDFAALQIFIKNKADFYIFTYTSYGDPAKEDSEYQNYLEVVRLAIDSFKFTEKSDKTEKEEKPKADGDGYVLVSNKGLSGFELYVPKEAEVTMSSTQVTAKLSDKANVTVTKSSSTGVGIVDYLKTRKTELEGLFGEVSDITIGFKTAPDLEGETANLFDGFDVDPVAIDDIKFGDLPENKLVVYEYSYSHLGIKYHVYQILGVDSFAGYVLTYTATEDEYALHLDTLDMILEKVKF